MTRGDYRSFTHALGHAPIHALPLIHTEGCRSFIPSGAAHSDGSKSATQNSMLKGFRARRAFARRPENPFSAVKSA